jgi:hypothetical protein
MLILLSIILLAQPCAARPAAPVGLLDYPGGRACFYAEGSERCEVSPVAIVYLAEPRTLLERCVRGCGPAAQSSDPQALPTSWALRRLTAQALAYRHSCRERPALVDCLLATQDHCQRTWGGCTSTFAAQPLDLACSGDASRQEGCASAEWVAGYLAVQKRCLALPGAAASCLGAAGCSWVEGRGECVADMRDPLAVALLGALETAGSSGAGAAAAAAAGHSGSGAGTGSGPGPANSSSADMRAPCARCTSSSTRAAAGLPPPAAEPAARGAPAAERGNNSSGGGGSGGTPPPASRASAPAAPRTGGGGGGPPMQQLQLQPSITLPQLLAQVPPSFAEQYLLLWRDCSSRASRAECSGGSPSLPAALPDGANATIAAYKSFDLGLKSPGAGNKGSVSAFSGANLAIMFAIILGTVWTIVFCMSWASTLKSRRSAAEA